MNKIFLFILSHKYIMYRFKNFIGGGKNQWTVLKHNGPYFPPEYQQHNIPIKDLAFRMMLSKPLASYKVQPQHVQAASQLQNANLKNIKSGDIIFFIKTVSGVKPLELSKENDVDVEKYISYLRGTFDQILDSIGYDFDEILGSTKIEDFFWS